MPGHLKSLKFWKTKSKPASTSITSEKPSTTPPTTITSSPSKDTTKPPIKIQTTPLDPTQRGVPVRPTVNPAYSAYSTPVDTKWADFPSTQRPLPNEEIAKAVEEGDVKAEEAARRKKAELEEQERLDFFQMM
ncbi:hypothetical protein B0J18DRAFT_71183 [Chaetomium sp. MPI-SDFR-AT-0129]|nr:hypothetical protein B0J18DRAFT_71183 [Chaetomium sp. MPI-SDFR-AT-0129]